MRLVAIFYLLAAVAALMLPPGTRRVGFGLLVGVAFALTLWRVRAGVALVLGLWNSGWCADQYLALRHHYSNQEVVALSGVVADFPRIDGRGFRFDLVVDENGYGNLDPRRNFRFAVSGRDPGIRPSVGAWCRLYVRPRWPRGFANFEAIDRERQYAARRVVALGSVVSHPFNRCYDIAPAWFPSKLRSALSQRIDEAVENRASAAVIAALAVADRSDVSELQWDLVRETGTAHLLAISGLHVATSAALGYFVVLTVAMLCGSHRRTLQANRVAWIGSLAAALMYSALAGFSVPSARACAMTAVAAVAAICGRRVLSFDNLLYALVLITVFDPLALLAESTWLSFTAVSVLVALCAYDHRSREFRWMKAMRVHLALAVAMAPLSGALFGAVPVVAPFANLFAVPWISLLLVPTLLAAITAAGLLPGLAPVAWIVAARLWEILQHGLRQVHSPVLVLEPGAWLVPATLGTWLFVLAFAAAPAMFRWRRSTLALGLVLMASPSMLKRSDNLRMTVLDVGQGLAVLVETAGSTVLYDAGPRWWGGGDAGARVVLPSLARANRDRLDVFVLSHADSDHLGGFAAVAESIVIDQIYVPPEESGVAPAAQICRRGARWRIDQVDYAFLHPTTGPGLATRNNRSCVLRVSAYGWTLLLSGDIEIEAEASLVTNSRDALRADVLVVPHHGSATSSSTEFLSAVQPSLAIVSAGLANRYGLPAESVITRYQQRDIPLFNTALAGAVRVQIDPRELTVETARDRRSGFWLCRPADGDRRCGTSDD